MFAVIKTGGKQYKVEKGQLLVLEKLAAHPGKKVQFNEVLLLGGDKTIVGNPIVKDAGVQAEVMDQIRGEKTISFVKRRRKSSSQRKKGHRQSLTVVRITDILASGAEKTGIDQANGAGGSNEDYGNLSWSKPSVRGILTKRLESKEVTNNEPKTKVAPKRAITASKKPKEKQTTKANVVSEESPIKKGAKTKNDELKKATKEKSTKNSETKKSKAGSKK